MIVIDNPKKQKLFLIDGLELEYLERNLKKYGISKSDLYITPYVKCARPVTKKAVTECSSWLMQEILTFNPKLVVLLIGEEDSENGKSVSYNTTLYHLTNKRQSDNEYSEKIFKRIREACS